MAYRRQLRFRFKWLRTAIAATLVFFVSWISLLAGTAHALDPNKHLTQYLHKSWRTQDGSAPAGMLSIAQTSDGFLWFTSVSETMYRFDGVQFLPWTLTFDGRTIDHIVSVYADHRGGLWAVEDHEIVHVYAGVVTASFPLLGQQRTENISEDPDGSLWVVQAAYGIDAPLCHISETVMKCFGESDGVPRTGAEALLADGKGGFWLGGQRAVVHWHAGVSEVYPIEALRSNAQDGVTALAFDSNALLWVGILPQGPGQGLGRLEKGVFRSFLAPGLDGRKISVMAMKVARDRCLWVGTLGAGLFRICGNAVEHYGRAEGLSGDTVQGLFEDKEGILWVTTTNGIDSFREPPITTFSALEGLGQGDDAVGVLAVRDGTIWVANGESLDHIEKNGAIFSIRQGKGLPGEQVSAMLEDRAGDMWMGVGGGLYLFKNGSFRRIAEPHQEPFGLILAMAEDTDGNVWAECSGKSRKLIRIRDFQVREEFPQSQIPNGRLAADPQGGIWIAPNNGNLLLFRGGVLKKFPMGSNGNQYIHHLTVQADGSVLAAYDDGLVGLREGKAQRLAMKNGLPCNTIYSFIKDKGQHWWFSTQCGVVELDDSELQRWWANPDAAIQTRLYDVLDGARPDQYGINPVALSSDGRVWFATGHVVQMLDPATLSETSLPAVTYVESLVANRKEFAVANNLKLPPQLRDLQIDYTSPTFATPQKVKFRYRLDGYDRVWHEAGTRRQAFYTDLPPGKYSFRVIASNSDGVWNGNAAKLDFSVAPAYYQTNWFRALCAAIFLVLVWAVYQLRLRQLARQFNMRLEERVGERTRIARDLHDTLLQSFQGMLLHFQTGINLLPERPGEARTTLDKAMHQAKHAIVEGREAIQGLRSSVVETNDLALAIRTLGEELAAGSNCAGFQVHVEGTPRDLHPILRDEIYRITGEGMRNAFLHADAKQIEVEIYYDERRVRVRVRDDGKGIDPKLLSNDGREGHFGLRGMRERAKLIGGKLTVWSELDAGAEVELSIPAARAYAAAAEGHPAGLAERFFAKLSGRGQ